jgi:hypothetical protein
MAPTHKLHTNSAHFFIVTSAIHELITKAQFSSILCRDNTITMSSESFDFTKRCMRVDMYAYAHKANVTFGAGALWVR